MSTFQHSRDDRYFDDYEPGAVFEFGPVVVSEDAIVRFAREFDPQPKHVDREAALAGPYGGLIVSGLHTLGMAMRILVDNYFSAVAALASPGVDEVRFNAPVRPGDTLRVRVTVLESRVSKSKSDRGIFTSLVEAVNQNGEVVMSFKGISMALQRPTGDHT
jgi:acyl dehydratase